MNICVLDNKDATLKVVHKHGPCSPHQAKTNHTQILQQDEYRVNSIRSRLSDKTADATISRGGRGSNTRAKKDATTLPAKSGAVVGSDNVLFGCGQNNQGLFGGSAGLLGLGRNKLSIIEQTAQKYNRYFSYCLPSTASKTGYLTLGNGGSASNSVKYTPLSTISGGASFYALQVLAISVGGKKLPISASLFQTAGTIIDSGTVITRLPPTAYGAMSSEFKKQMSSLGYPTAPALSILDTCYDLSKYKSVTIPKIGFFFGGGTTVDLDATGILYASKISQVCLAFAGNGDDGDVAIFGNVQQKTLQVVYDIGGGRIGFGTSGC
ncbi:hypothetical protein F8388_014334 [Cannabis sativa]|uniref:Peptidase A1 domain-containing protein n=1 Tax=Cannabis sativa TaxID=3483 RepID=A0A7J6EJH8_CANSA|nr:hypothetical protein F8388_014334 [Cannabis sativa]